MPCHFLRSHMVTSCSSKHLLLHCSHGECLQLGYASPVDVARGVSAKCTRSPNAKRVRKGVPFSDLHIIIYCHIYWYNTAFFSQGMPNIGALALRFLRDRIKRLCWHVDTHSGTRAGTESGRCRAGCCSFQVKIQRMPGRGLESPPHCWHRPLRVVGTSVLVSTSVALCGLAVTLSVTPDATVPSRQDRRDFAPVRYKRRVRISTAAVVARPLSLKASRQWIRAGHSAS